MQKGNPTMEDARVIGEVLSGNRDRYAELVERYKKMVYAIAWSHLGDTDASEDAAQETFVRAFSYLRTLRDPGHFPAWLAQIARNVCRTTLRSSSREAAFLKHWTALEESHAQSPAPVSASLADQVQHALSQIPAVHRECLTLYYIEGKNTRDAAAALGISESAMKVRLHRARGVLRGHVEARLEESLESLQPGSRFTASVMGLLPANPAGFWGTGGALGLLGKAFASVSWMAWTMLATSLIWSGLIVLLSRQEARSIRDVPKNRFRIAQIYRNALATGACVLLAQVIGSLVTQLALRRYVIPMNLSQMYQAIALIAVIVGIPQVRLLSVNRTPYAWAQVAMYALLGGCYTAIGFFHAPVATFYVGLLLINALVIATDGQAPRRMDYNLFLRAATGGVGDGGGRSHRSRGRQTFNCGRSHGSSANNGWCETTRLPGML
jgi:RNA polymerase sigma-70 factor (ECF subfamily)